MAYSLPMDIWRQFLTGPGPKYLSLIEYCESGVFYFICHDERFWRSVLERDFPAFEGDNYGFTEMLRKYISYFEIYYLLSFSKDFFGYDVDESPYVDLMIVHILDIITSKDVVVNFPSKLVDILMKVPPYMSTIVSLTDNPIIFDYIFEKYPQYRTFLLWGVLYMYNLRSIYEYVRTKYGRVCLPFDELSLIFKRTKEERYPPDILEDIILDVFYPNYLAERELLEKEGEYMQE